MKKITAFCMTALLAVFALALPVKTAFANDYNTLVHGEMGGDTLTVESGGTLSIKSGGNIAVASGGSLTMASGSTITVAGTISGSTMDLTGNVHMGAANHVSTFTATSGNIDAGGAISAVGSVTAGGALSGAAVNISGSGQLLLGNATSAEIGALAPGQAHGAMIFNTDIGGMCQSTDTVVGSWVISTNTATACF